LAWTKVFACIGTTQFHDVCSLFSCTVVRDRKEHMLNSDSEVSLGCRGPTAGSLQVSPCVWHLIVSMIHVPVQLRSKCLIIVALHMGMCHCRYCLVIGNGAYDSIIYMTLNGRGCAWTCAHGIITAVCSWCQALLLAPEPEDTTGSEPSGVLSNSRLAPPILGALNYIYIANQTQTGPTGRGSNLCLHNSSREGMQPKEKELDAVLWRWRDG
jgi:hypothetical protein